MILSVSNRKGGVGKTSVTANLAWEMQHKGRKVLMLDLDSQCDLTYIYKWKNSSKQKTIYDVLEDDLKLKDAFYKVTDNLYLIPGDDQLDEYETKWNYDLLEKKLEAKSIKKKFDVVIIDHPPGLTNASKAGYMASDSVIIIVEPDSFNLKNVDTFLTYLQKIQKQNNKLMVLGLVLNKIDNRRKITKYVKESMQSNYEDHLFKTEIGIDTAVINAIEQRIPIRELFWRSKNVTRFRDLSTEIFVRRRKMLNDRLRKKQAKAG